MKLLLKTLIRMYQWILSPMLGDCCKFYPSCSQYAIESIEKHGVLKGIFRSTKRILKCNPWHKGGIDLP